MRGESTLSGIGAPIRQKARARTEKAGSRPYFRNRESLPQSAETDLSPP
jgi:hypothetical protein